MAEIAEYRISFVVYVTDTTKEEMERNGIAEDEEYIEQEVHLWSEDLFGGCDSIEIIKNK